MVVFRALSPSPPSPPSLNLFFQTGAMVWSIILRLVPPTFYPQESSHNVLTSYTKCQTTTKILRFWDKIAALLKSASLCPKKLARLEGAISFQTGGAILKSMFSQKRASPSRNFLYQPNVCNAVCAVATYFFKDPLPSYIIDTSNKLKYLGASYLPLLT